MKIDDGEEERRGVRWTQRVVTFNGYIPALDDDDDGLFFSTEKSLGGNR